MKTALSLILLTTIIFTFVPNSFAQVVDIPDPFFKAQLHKALNKPSDYIITKQDLESLTELHIVPSFADWVARRTSRDITGIEHATNLTILNIHRTQVSNLTPLSGLTKLTWLQLASNDITDISPLAGLTNLDYLHLADNNVRDITSLSGLTRLTTLFLGANQIMDIRSLTTLTNLTDLSARQNQITDISPLTTLTKLTSLNLGSNPITDISSLTALTHLTGLTLYDCGITDTDLKTLTALTHLTSLSLSVNQIRDVSPLTALTNLESLFVDDNPITNIEPLLTLLRQNEGIEIYLMGPFGLSDPLTEENANEYQPPIIQDPDLEDELVPTTLEKHSGDKQQEIPQVWLTTPFVVRVLDQHGAPLAGVQVLFAETSNKGYVSETEVATDEQGLAATHLKLRVPLGDYTVTARVEGISEIVTFTATAVPRQVLHPYPEPVPVPEPVLEPEPHPVPEPVIITNDLHDIVISEIMFETKGDIKLYPQWIELYNPTDTAINLNGWKIAASSESVTIATDFVINPKQARLLVSKLARFSHQTMHQHRVYELNDTLINVKDFQLRLVDNKDKVIDDVRPNGWELPSGIVKLENDARTSIIRRFDDGTPRAGEQRDAWIRAYNTKGAKHSKFWYGHPTDIGSPGYRSSHDPLPVQLSAFTAKFDGDTVVIHWATESELDNAGFNIYRSETKAGEFKQVNVELIRGAGTTGERTDYTWIDTTAKTNVAYYYQIEDVSFAGERQTLTTARTKGIVSAKDKHLTQWAELKR